MNDAPAPRHPSVASILEFFEYDHLPEHLQEVSYLCQELAGLMADHLPDSPELAAGLRKLLEAKDCFVRAAVVANRRQAVIVNTPFVRTCRVCGCTDDRACTPPCSWVEVDLCNNPECLAQARTGVL